MSRILLLLIFLLWMGCRAEGGEGAGRDGLLEVGARTAVFLGFYALLVVVMRVWSVLLARRVDGDNFQRSLRRFNFVMLIARGLVPAWFAVGLLVLGWYDVVDALLAPLGLQGWSPLAQLPGLLIGTLPAFAVWTALWWSQYPADRALREQNMLIHVETGMPVHASPTLRQYLAGNLRLQVLFTVVPILLIVLLRDAGAIALNAWTGRPPDRNIEELLISLGAAAMVFILAPEILRRILQTEPLPDSPLRRRLEAMCRRSRMRYRDILLWRTQNNMGNAAVMGVVPQVRYILLSDLLLERMDDEQIEAVFAHEVGHVVHRHMAWFIVFFVVFFGGIAVLEHVFKGDLESFVRRVGASADAVAAVSAPVVAGGFLLLFGYLSRRFERQADVYAARTMEAVGRAQQQQQESQAGAVFAQMDAAGMSAGGAASVATMSPPPRVAPPVPAAARTPVGQYGATLFASALHRVAVINNIPVSPRRRHRRRGPFRRRLGHWIDDAVEAMHNWFHGSIAARMDYLRGLSADPALTGRFDRFMARLYLMLFALLLASSAAVAFVTMRG